MKIYVKTDIIRLNNLFGGKILYITRTQKLLDILCTDACLITSPENIYYFSGFTGGEGALFISKNRRILFTDSRYTVQASEQAKNFQLVDVAEKSLSDFIKNENVNSIGFEEDFVTFEKFLSLKKMSEESAWIPISDKIYKLRMIKDAFELNAISTAAKLADNAFSYILTQISPGKTEREIALMLEFYMRNNGADGLSFETIVASGVRSAMPHGIATDKIIEKGDLLTLDFGCKYKGYCSDMTRTIVIGKSTEKQKQIYETVLFAQTSALNELSSGVPANLVDSTARNIIKDAGFGKYFGHGLGHSLGLMVHEKPSLSPKCTDILLPNVLMTVEPGIYIDNFGGVRIEDLVVITEDGYNNLVASPKEFIEL